MPANPSRGITRRVALFSASSVVALLTAPALGQPTPARRPNILYIMAGDMGYPYSMASYLKQTPNACGSQRMRTHA